jgi:hypothetical protein
MPDVALDEQSHFRITVWPSVPLPLPRYTRRDKYLLDSTCSALIGSPESVEVTERRGEAYLRLYGLDLDDPQAILAYANAHGVFFDVGWVHKRLIGTGPFREPYPAEDELEQIRRVYSTDPRLTSSLADEDGLFVGTLDGFRHAARCIRDLTTAWRMVKGEIGADPSALEALPVRTAGANPYLDVKDVLLRGLSELLSGFRPIVGSGPPDPDPEPEFDLPRWTPDDDREAEESPIGVTTVPSGALRLEARSSPRVDGLEEICALELFNHIVSGEVYRQCQNENCRRLFVLQYGRARHGMNKREGVMYCSASCARATAQRAYRRRKAAERSATQRRANVDRKTTSPKR